MNRLLNFYGSGKYAFSPRRGGVKIHGSRSSGFMLPQPREVQSCRSGLEGSGMRAGRTGRKEDDTMLHGEDRTRSARPASTGDRRRRRVESRLRRLVLHP